MAISYDLEEFCKLTTATRRGQMFTLEVTHNVVNYLCSGHAISAISTAGEATYFDLDGDDLVHTRKAH